MRAWRVEEFGEPADVWQLQENAEDCEPGPGEIKVAVEAAGLGLGGLGASLPAIRDSAAANRDRGQT